MRALCMTRGRVPSQIQLAEVDKQLIDGADEYCQLCNLLAFTMRYVRGG